MSLRTHQACRVTSALKEEWRPRHQARDYNVWSKESWRVTEWAVDWSSFTEQRVELVPSRKFRLFYVLPTHYLFDKWHAEGLKCKIFSEETEEYIKTVEEFLTLDFFIIETVTAKDEP
ncbi:hypothetical protein llap_961 [Limosa lapponica baueri]|uniref:Uncharacterized protein n=1 Tax=Limosa lapponica baueri TaxID=1758121 RepID=A0A2I0URV1_LIMLA|nr:hypothetical protein llap_961 [Limosa lapponica baueri]